MCWHLRKMGELLSSKTHFNISVQANTFIRMESESRTKERAVDELSVPEVKGGRNVGEFEYAASPKKEKGEYMRGKGLVLCLFKQRFVNLWLIVEGFHG